MRNLIARYVHLNLSPVVLKNLRRLMFWLWAPHSVSGTTSTKWKIQPNTQNAVDGKEDKGENLTKFWISHFLMKKLLCHYGSLHDFNLIERGSIFKRRFHNRSRVSLNSLTWGIDWWREKILPVTILDPSVVLLKVPNSFPYTVYDICRQTEYIEMQTVVYRL